MNFNDNWIIYRIRNFFKKGSLRTVKLKKNIILSLFVKGASILMSFLFVPILIQYLGKSSYGIWVTIGSVITWASFFDFGLEQGLRNRLAEALTRNNLIEARKLVSTSYALLALIFGIVFLIFLIVQSFLNWSQIFNVSKEINSELKYIMLIVFSSFLVQFFLKIIYTILFADQRPGLVDLFRLISKLLSFIVIVSLTQFTEGSLKNVAWVFSISPVIIMIVSSFYFYIIGTYKDLRPSLSTIDFKLTKKILNLGIQFFVMQISVVIMFSTDNMIITQLFGPEQVTVYDIAYKYFNVLTILFTIIIFPFRIAATEAYTKNEINWIKKSANKLLLIWSGFVLICIFLVVVSNLVYSIWIGSNIQIPILLSVIMALYVVLYMFGNIYVQIINGIGKVRVQFYFSIFAAIINIPLSIFLARNLNLGSTGVILATILSNIYGPFIAPFHYKKLIKYRARGVWNK